MEWQKETIFAVASGVGRAAVAVIRLSGPHAGATLVAMAGRLPHPRRASLTRLRDPLSGELIDQGLALWFPAPASFTGEDCVELQVHGSRAVVAAILRLLAVRHGHRLAEPGEFARRAFLNGRMDLAQIEGLADLVDSETEHQRRHALAQLDGVLGRKTEIWRGVLLQALALIEAEIDFADEGDAPSHVLPQIRALIGAAVMDIGAVIEKGFVAERLREGFLVVICGPPNVGKSTFLNHIAKRDVAIVSDHPGTTRDILEIFLDISGIPVRMVDTAGLRISDNPVENQGISKAQKYIVDADLVLMLQDSQLSCHDQLPAARQNLIWTVRTKSDLPEGEAFKCDFSVSSKNGAGIPNLLAEIGHLAQQCFGSGGMGEAVRERHWRILTETIAALKRVLDCNNATQLELVAEDLRLASRSLGRVTGRIGVEDILDEIFSRFCLGK